MTRYAIDAGTALRLVSDGARAPEDHQLVGPSRLRSDVMVRLYAMVRSGELDDAAARVLLDRLASLRIRLLGDRVSRAVAWTIARDHGWGDPGPAEYLAVARLQADRLVTTDATLAAAADVPLAPIEELYGPPGESGGGTGN